jgi:hypothetical protein
MAEYIRLGWETGIYNEFRELQMRGMTRAQIMEVVMYAQLSGAGIRGMGHVHDAVGKSLFDWRDGGGADFPEGWAPDPNAFKAGLDLTVGHFTEQDRTNLEGWYEATIGCRSECALRSSTTGVFSRHNTRSGRPSSRSCQSRWRRS